MLNAKYKLFIFLLFFSCLFFILSLFIFSQARIAINNQENNQILLQLRSHTYPYTCSKNCVSLFLPKEVKSCGFYDSHFRNIIIVPGNENIVFYSAENTLGKNIVDFTLATHDDFSILNANWSLSEKQPVIIDMYNKTMIVNEQFLSHSTHEDLIHDINFIISSFCTDIENNT